MIHDEQFKSVLDLGSVGVIIASFMEAVPNITALLALIWMAIRLWETDTVRGWTGRNLPERRRDSY